MSSESPLRDPSNETTAPRPFTELADSGLLWLVNAVVFHPRGFALALIADQHGDLMGWELLGDGSEPYEYDRLMDARFAAAEQTFAAAREAEAGP